MPVISFKEVIMLLLGFGLVYCLYFLRTHGEIFTNTQLEVNQTIPEIDVPVVEVAVKENILPQAIREEVQIPEWLSNKDDFDLSNLTLDNLLQLAYLSHEQDHDFFPDGQNTLVYLLKAKALGVDSTEVDELLTTLHAKLYDQAELALSIYDANTLTAMTARIKSLDSNDPKILYYTDQISLIYTLERLSNTITEKINTNQIYQADQDDAVHYLLIALNLDPNYPPILDLKNKLLNQTEQLAMRAAQELDFSMADEHFALLQTIDTNHYLTLQTKNKIESLKQNRFAYLDQQFYLAINDLNLARAEEMTEQLNDLAIASSQLSGYQNLIEKAKNYGPYDVKEKFNDLLKSGNTGPTMVVMPMGEFNMGSQLGAKHQRPSHLVQINYGFAVSQNEITVGEFAQFIQASGYLTTAEKNKRAQVYDEGTGRFKEKYNINWRHDYLGKNAALNLPVIHVSWEDAQAYASWLNSSTGKQYRLLSESEFEYLLDGNKQALYPWGNDNPNQIWGNFSGAKDKFKRSRIRWREGFPDYEDGHWGPAPVGSFISSLNGLNDLSGNVMEWVEDCWHDSYTRAPDDGTAWVNPGCENRVIRGGNWGSAIEEYQVKHRKKAEIKLTDPRLGFRVAQTFNFTEK